MLVNEEDFHRVKDAERTTVVCRPQDFMSFEASVSYSIRTSLRSERRPRYGDAVIKLTDLIFDGSGGVPESLDVETPCSGCTALMPPAHRRSSRCHRGGSAWPSPVPSPGGS
ncbi:hypothetical protein [Thermogymnomonas acidicola]|uniref:hypothetical protein n=1 Tax=Thermogymnomonas acidicola TaxID=399579 RepID=UPI0009465A82|nr:hypothetical protein [Thermogymnomonas acidicola]